MILTLLIIVPLSLVIFQTLSSSSEFMYYTIERFSGDQIRSKRFDQSDNAEELFRRAPVLGLGAQNFDEQGGTTVTDNPYEILAKDGVVGFIITYLPLIYIVLKYWRRKEVLFAAAILMLDYVQRPFHINEMHYLMLYLFCLLIEIKYSRPIRESQYQLFKANVKS